MIGTLYIVATPIGNMQDISLRALQTLFSADIIACEDTRRTGLLLQKLKELYSKLVYYTHETQGLSTNPKLISYYDQVETQKTPELINMLLQGLNVAIISDAGTPLVSDPGYRITKAAIEAGIPIETIPGPSAVLTALTISGLPNDKFFFLGYLPKKSGHRKELLESLKNLQNQLKTTVIFFEAPHRLLGTLEELQESLGSEKYIVVARELTKTYEEVKRGCVIEMLQYFQKNTPKGEFVLLFNTEN